MSHNLENNNLEKRVAYRNSIVGGLTQASCSCGLRGMAARDCNCGGEGRRQTVGRGTEGHFKRGAQPKQCRGGEREERRRARRALYRTRALQPGKVLGDDDRRTRLEGPPDAGGRIAGWRYR